MKSELWYEVKAFKDPVFFAEYLLSTRKGKKATVFPWQRDVLREFYSGNYRDLVLCVGRRSGKTVLASIITAYELFRLLLINDVEEYYDLPPGSHIYIMNVATSEDQALRTVFAQTEARITNSWWFQKQNYIQRYNEFEFPDIRTHVLSTHSNSASLVGALCKCVIIDEMARFKQTDGPGSAKMVYDAVSQSVRDFGDEGHVIVLSSPLLEDDFFYSELVKKGRKIPTVLVKQLPTWKCNPKITYESLEPERLRNPETFWRDFGAQPSKSLEPYFRDWDKVLQCVDKSRSHPIDDQGNFYKEFRPVKYARYILAGDPAYKNDAFGFAMVHKANDGKIVVDLVHKMTPKNGVEINPFDVKDFVIKLTRLFPIDMVVFDTWMYPETIAEIKKRGVEVAQNIVTIEEYDTLKELLYTNRIVLYEHEDLLTELRELQLIKGRKVDHPKDGSKDIADALANATFFCHKQVPYRKPHWLVLE